MHCIVTWRKQGCQANSGTTKFGEICPRDRLREQPPKYVVQESGREWVPSGRVVFLEMHCLLFGEAGAVAPYCMVARTNALACCAVLLMAVDHYIDGFIAAYLKRDGTVVDDLKLREACPPCALPGG